MIRILAEAFLQAVQAQSHDHRPSPMAYRDGADLRDVQFVGQIDVLAAMREAVLAIREATDEMEEAGSAYVDRSQHVAVDGIWTAMIDAAMADDRSVAASAQD